jgi:hypothetical protein
MFVLRSHRIIGEGIVCQAACQQPGSKICQRIEQQQYTQVWRKAGEAVFQTQAIAMTFEVPDCSPHETSHCEIPHR